MCIRDRGSPPRDCCGGVGAHGADYLGPQHAGVHLNVDPKNPLPFGTPGSKIFVNELMQLVEFLGRRYQQASLQYPDDPALQARIKSYELAFRMQMAVPEVMQLSQETKATESLYGLDTDTTRPFGQLCLTARRLAERGVRFVQLYHKGWESHTKLEADHERQCQETDQPIAALLSDLEQRSLLDSTLVVWGGEFGRMPFSEGKNAPGRNHNPYGFCMWMAGGGVKGGMSYGETDEFGFEATVNRAHVHDIHATMLHLMGLDHERLTYFHQGREESLPDDTDRNAVHLPYRVRLEHLPGILIICRLALEGGVLSQHDVLRKELDWGEVLLHDLTNPVHAISELPMSGHDIHPEQLAGINHVLAMGPKRCRRPLPRVPSIQKKCLSWSFRPNGFN